MGRPADLGEEREIGNEGLGMGKSNLKEEIPWRKTHLGRLEEEIAVGGALVAGS